MIKQTLPYAPSAASLPITHYVRAFSEYLIAFSSQIQLRHLNFSLPFVNAWLRHGKSRIMQCFFLVQVITPQRERTRANSTCPYIFNCGMFEDNISEILMSKTTSVPVREQWSQFLRKLYQAPSMVFSRAS